MYKLKLLKYILSSISALIIIFPICTYASSASPGKITAYFVDQNGIVFFDTTGTRSSKPSCADPAKNKFSFKADSIAKQAMFSSIMTAHAMGKTVIISGSDNCNEDPSVETATSIILQ